MSERKEVGVISLGVMRQRMPARMTEQPRARAGVAWDANPLVVAEVQKRTNP